MFFSQEPFCIILTHRHGASVGIFQKIPLLMLKGDFLETASHYLANKKSLLKVHENFEYLEEHNNFVISRVLGKTAENLLNLYKFTNQKFAHTQNRSFILGVGPGSFTGLRLGCAFVNGLNLPFDHELYSVSTKLIDDFCNILKNKQELLEEFIQELGNFRENDQSSGYVTFFDMFYTIHEILNHNIKLCSTLLPQYGQEPTPVLKLRKD